MAESASLRRVSNIDLFRTFVRELTTFSQTERVPEPDLVMDDPAKVEAFDEAGAETGVMAPVYLHHTAHICSIVRPGDTVIDLGCGPARQIAMAARLNPDTRFLGVDLSDEMLGRARKLAADQNLNNLDFTVGDITKLAAFDDNSIDAVVSTVVLHQLLDVEMFRAALQQAGRVLKPGGGIYIVDFARLKSLRSIEYFAHQYEGSQPELFTEDYYNSLRAAFSLADWRAAAADFLGNAGRLYATPVIRFMVAIKSPERCTDDGRLRGELAAIRDRLPEHHKVDLKNLLGFFKGGGLRNTLLA